LADQSNFCIRTYWSRDMSIKSRMAFIVIILSLSFSASSIEVKENKLECQLNQLNWLIGEWSDQSQKTQELWRKVSAATFEGEGRIKKNNQWNTYESLRLVDMSGSIFFIAKVGHNRLPVAFKASECLPDSVSFINEAHDFPNALIYKRVSENQLLIEVKGADGKGFNVSLTKQSQD
jgi:hypothetical protein